MGKPNKKHLRYLVSQLPNRILENGNFNLTLEEKAALWSYTGDDYLEINRELWEDNLSPEVQRLHSAILSALAKLPTYQGLVYRRTFAKYFGDLSEGKTLTMTGFSSFTEDVARLKDFSGDIVFVLKSTKGDRISEFSQLPEEKEVIYPNGAIFVIDKVVIRPSLTINEISETSNFKR